MPKYCMVCWLFICLIYSNAQGQYLSNDLEVLVTIDQKQLRQKALMQTAKQYNFLDLLLFNYKEELGEQYKIVEELRDNPHALGLDTSQHIYLFVDQVDEHLQTGVHFYLSSQTRFERTLDSLTMRERTRIGIPDNAPEKLRKALLEQQAKQDAFWASMRPKAIPNTNFKMLKLLKVTYVWTDDRAYVFKTQGINEWQNVDYSDNKVAARLFQSYKKARAASKETYIRRLAELKPQLIFKQKNSDETADVAIWLSSGETFLFPPASSTNDSPQPTPMQLLLGDLLADASGEQYIRIHFGKHHIDLQQQYRAADGMQSSNGKTNATLSRDFLKKHQLLKIEHHIHQSASSYFQNKRILPDDFYPLNAMETSLRHGFQTYATDVEKKTKQGLDTIPMNVVLPVFTSILTFGTSEEQKDFLKYLQEKDFIRPTKQTNYYQSSDTSYTAHIFSHPKGLLWSMKSDIKKPATRDTLLAIAQQCPDTYAITDMRASVETLSMELPVLFTPLYRSIKNNWRTSEQRVYKENGKHIRQWKFGGFPKKDPTATSVDMLLEIVNAFYTQVEREASEQ